MGGGVVSTNLLSYEPGFFRLSTFFIFLTGELFTILRKLITNPCHWWKGICLMYGWPTGFSSFAVDESITFLLVLHLACNVAYTKRKYLTILVSFEHFLASCSSSFPALRWTFFLHTQVGNIDSSIAYTLLGTGCQSKKERHWNGLCDEDNG